MTQVRKRHPMSPSGDRSRIARAAYFARLIAGGQERFSALTGQRLGSILPPHPANDPLPFSPMTNPSPSVLIVDTLADNREVLRTVLERRGLRIFEADQA